MDLGTVFKLSLYGLTAIVGAILGAAEGEGSGAETTRHELLLPYLSLPVVICGYLFTERRVPGRSTSSMGLSSFWANLLAIVALVATGREFMSENREGKLLAGAHLLLYATWIVLFQQKTIRLYWFLMALGILQLAVSSVLTSKGWFGFSAIGYMFCAVWTLSIFSLWRAEQSFEEDRQRLLAEGSATADDNLVTPASVRRRSASEVRSTVQHEDGTQWLTVRFVSGVLMTTCSALVVSAAFFAFIPRVWVGSEFSFQDELDSSSAVVRKTGMATSIKLGDLSKVLESSERVFEIQILDQRTKVPIPLQKYSDEIGMAEPLFRGAVFNNYERGRWNAERGTELHYTHFNRLSLMPKKRNTAVLQIIRLEPTTLNILFCLGQPESMFLNDSPYGLYDEVTGVAARPESKNDNVVLEYTAFAARPEQEQLNYKVKVTSKARDTFKKSDYLKHSQTLPFGLNRLKELSDDIIEKERAHRQVAEGRETRRDLSMLEIASALEYYLRETGLYKYSLVLEIKDPKIDPVEDFLFNRKSGHCEYFATALALMIRSQGIPARVVSGYKGGVRHEKRHETFEVQQRFSHLWVEALVDDEAWTTFDATPLEARTTSIADVESKSRPSVWTGVQTTLSGLWSENVLNMSLARQEQSIYKPMRELAFSVGRFIQQLVTSPTAALATLWELLTDREQWLSIGGVLFGLACLVSISGLIWLARRGLLWFGAWYSDHLNRQNRQRRRIVAFYERFAQLMRARGLKRETTQTQHEFAQQVTSTCLSELSIDGLEDVPDQISQLFYRVRFGDEYPSATELHHLENVLIKLEQALSNEANRGRVQSAARPQ